MKRYIPYIALCLMLIGGLVWAIPPMPPSTASSGVNTTYDANSDSIIDADKVATLNQDTTGNASTATALASDPSDCAALGLATAIDASGNLTCGYAIGTDVPGISGTPTDEQIVCWEQDGSAWKQKACGAKTTDNSTASHLLCKDSAGEVENCGGVTISGTTSPVININPAEVDGHTTSTDLTAAQVSNTVIHNYDQAASDVFLIAPAAAAGYSALFTVVTAQDNHWCFEAAASDKIYLIAAAGTVAAGDEGAAVCMMAAQLGQSFACWTFKSGASSYDWMCKAIAIGTSTFEAHASSE